MWGQSRRGQLWPHPVQLGLNNSKIRNHPWVNHSTLNLLPYQLIDFVKYSILLNIVNCTVFRNKRYLFCYKTNFNPPIFVQIYVFLWFWFVAVAIFSILALLYRYISGRRWLFKVVFALFILTFDYWNHYMYYKITLFHIHKSIIIMLL
jgi:hypothetical protein